MNNRGWGLNEMLVLCFILVVALFISATMFQNIINKTDNSNVNYDAKYQALEVELTNASKTYFKAHFDPDTNTVMVVITVSQLLKDGSLDHFKDPKDSSISCSGYVIKEENTYTPYITCGNNYSSLNYTTVLDQ